MAIKNENQAFQYALLAAEDLSNATAGTGAVYKAIAADDRKFAANGLEAVGIICYGGQSGNHITCDTVGQSKFTAGGAVGAGARLTVAGSGYLVAATSGTYVVGRALETAVASGAVGAGLFNFATPYFMTSSN